MGPRLPGDKGPSARPDKPRNLTHNPFAALAAKVEASRPEDAPPETPPEPVASPEPVAPAAEAAPAPVPAAEPATAPAPADAGGTGEPTP